MATTTNWERYLETHKTSVRSVDDIEVTNNSLLIDIKTAKKTPGLDNIFPAQLQQGGEETIASLRASSEKVK